MIQVDNVTKSYRRGQNEVRALRGLSCAIAGQALTFIVGPSGSGKSTLLYLLGSLDQPNSGEIRVNGKSLRSMSSRERDAYRRDQVGFVFQNFNLLGNLDAIENVLVPRLPRGLKAEDRREAQAILDRVGLGHRLDHRPHQLSGGEQQRVAIARALLKKPLLVLADEPTGELDSESGAEVYRYLRELRAEHGTTVVIVTHDRTHIRPDDHVLSIRDGRVDHGEPANPQGDH